MKNKNLLKILVFVAAIILISLISFVGIYKYEKGEMVKVMPDYKMAKEFKGSRLISLNVDTSTKEKNSSDTTSENNADENTVDENTTSEDATAENTTEDNATTENTTSETEPVNAPEVLNKDNYLKVKSILQKRLLNLNIDEFDVRVNEEDGQVVMELPDDTTTDEILQFLTEPGKFEIQATDTKEVLLSKDNIEKASVIEYPGKTGKNIYLNIKFKDDSIKKLEEVTKTYTETTAEDGTSTKKTITLKIDDQTLLTTYFGETISNGQIQIPIGDETTDTVILNNNRKNANYLATVLNTPTLPITYKLDQNQFVSALYDENCLKCIAAAAIILVTLVMIYLIIKYKESGIISAISLVGFIAITMLAIRYMNVTLSIGSLVAILFTTIMEIVFLSQLSKNNENKEMNKSIIKSILLQIPFYLISIILVLLSAYIKLEIVSFVTALFIGLAIELAYNYFIVKNVLKS